MTRWRSLALSGAALVREAVRRSVSDQGAGHAVVVPRCQYPPSPSEAYRRHEPGRASQLEPRSRVTTLRI